MQIRAHVTILVLCPEDVQSLFDLQDTFTHVRKGQNKPHIVRNIWPEANYFLVKRGVIEFHEAC